MLKSVKWLDMKTVVKENGQGLLGDGWNYFFLFLIFNVLSGNVYSDTLFVSRIGVEQGLSQNNVTSIAQDQKGFMWLGTQTALNRFDGNTFKKYENDNRPGSISNSATWSLLVDRKGVLWVGTYGGLNRYDELSDSFKSFQYDANNPNSLSHNTVWSLQEDVAGSIWVGTGEGLNRFDPVSERFTRFLNDPDKIDSISNDVINAIYQDGHGVLWVGTDRGLNRFHNDTQSFETVDDSSSLLRQAVVTSIVEDGKGYLWVGTDGHGIFVLDQLREVVSHRVHEPAKQGSLSTDKIKVIIKDSQNRLWIGTDNGGLNRIDEGSDDFLHYKRNSSDQHSLSENIIFSLYEDKTGVIWIGTYTQGISKLNPFGFSLTLNLDYVTLENPDPHIDIRGFLVDRKKNLWVASSSNGIRVTSANGNKIAYLHDPKDSFSIASNRVYSFYEDSDGIVWVGTANGWLNQFNSENKNFTRYKIETLASDGIRHGKILAITEDSTGLLWLGDERGGAHSFDRKEKKFMHYHHDPMNPNSISFDRVSDVYIDPKDNIWLASYGGGLSFYDRQNERFIAYRTDSSNVHSVGGDNINCIHVDENDENILWLGISGSGLDRLDLKSGRFTHFGISEGLSDSYVYGIVQEKNYLWLSHNYGISRFDINTEKFSNYERQDGLQHNEFNGPAYYKAPDGKLYLGGILGYNAFYTDQIIDNPYKPPVYITEFQLFNKPVGVNEKHNGHILLRNSIVNTDELVLSYKDSVFSFAFSSLDYASPIKNEYAYMMEGLEEDWNYVDSARRYATYTTLQPGNYTFRVKASNNNGLWNEEGAELAITITPPFWQTWWFRVFSAVMIALLFFTVYAYRVKSIQERNKLLKDEVKARTSELQKEKSNLESTLIELGETKDALIEAAHKAGMADTATGVLHNVGNLLNSVNTSSGVMRETFDASVSKRFLKAGKLLVENQDNLIDFVTKDPKGGKLLDYLISLIGPFERENELLSENAIRLSEKIGAIAETIASQQMYAKGGAFVESLSLEKLVEESIALQSGSIERHEIKIERVFGSQLPEVKVQKTKFVQIVINLLKNAKESMDDCPDRESLLKLEIKRDEENAYIIFTDNGTGIEKDKLESIFSHGFTTKSNGHGFGLHSCANYMTEMGGKLWAESDGLDKGAKFIMRFELNDVDKSYRVNGDFKERKMA